MLIPAASPTLRPPSPFFPNHSFSVETPAKSQIIFNFCDKQVRSGLWLSYLAHRMRENDWNKGVDGTHIECSQSHETSPPTSLFQIALSPNLNSLLWKDASWKAWGIDIIWPLSHSGYLELFKSKGAVAVNLYLVNKSLKPKVIYGFAEEGPEWPFTSTWFQ